MYLAERVQILGAIPGTITSLDLSDNGLDKFTPAELVLLLKAIPATVTSINVGKNNLFTNKTIIERDCLLKSLQPFEQNGRLQLSHNGEAAFARALLPMLSLVKQKKLPFDIVSHILGQLLSNPGNKSEIALVNNKIAQSVMSKNGLLIKQGYSRNGASFFQRLSLYFGDSTSKMNTLKNRARNNPESAEAKTLEHFCLRVH